MDFRFRLRLAELLDDAQVSPDLFRAVLPRLETFLQPFGDLLDSPTQRTHTQLYVQGLLSELKSKDAESIAYLHDRDRQGLPKYLGQSTWGPQPLLTELVRQVADQRGEPDGVLVFDPSAFPKKGTESVGVPRQWCGRLGKVDNGCLPNKWPPVACYKASYCNRLRYRRLDGHFRFQLKRHIR